MWKSRFPEITYNNDMTNYEKIYLTTNFFTKMYVNDDTCHFNLCNIHSFYRTGKLQRNACYLEDTRVCQMNAMCLEMDSLSVNVH